jgi:glycerol-3-phosphate acyltransferase PlsY
MITVWSISSLILAYLLGSIPTAVWIGQAFYKIDVREYGSGNAGATNTFRVLGKKAGIPVMCIDILKGFTATNLAYLSILGMPSAVNNHSVVFTNYELSFRHHSCNGSPVSHICRLQGRQRCSYFVRYGFGC